MLVSSEEDIRGIQSSEALLETMWYREQHRTVGTQLTQFRTESAFGKHWKKMSLSLLAYLHNSSLLQPSSKASQRDPFL